MSTVKVPQLRAECVARGISTSGLRKAELVAALRAHSPSAAAADSAGGQEAATNGGTSRGRRPAEPQRERAEEEEEEEEEEGGGADSGGAATMLVSRSSLLLFLCFLLAFYGALLLVAPGRLVHSYGLAPPPGQQQQHLDLMHPFLTRRFATEGCLMVALAGAFHAVAHQATPRVQRAVLLWSALPMLAAFGALHGHAYAAARAQGQDASGMTSLLALEAAAFVLVAASVLFVPAASAAHR